MQATFGKLQGKTLELQDGLNIIEAPNETGKSTWCAFLSSMFYGVNSRDRDRGSSIADKNRYAPWSGSAMSGRMEVKIGQREVTLIRDTKRAGAPMADLTAVWAGTGEAIPGITAQNCGEAILGVSREVFERSAFIRQAGLPIRQDPDLEKRIAALISSGEEDTSCSEATTALKKQLNRRRHNKTGQIPSLEAELLEVEKQLNAVSELHQKLEIAQKQAVEQESQLARLNRELDACYRWELQEQHLSLSKAEEEASLARAKADTLRRRLTEARIPDNHDIGRLRGALVNIQSTRKNVEKARDERDETMKAALRAEAPVNDSPFAGQSAESAQREANREPPKVSRLPAVFTGLFLAAAAVCVVLHLNPELLQVQLPVWVPVIPAALTAVSLGMVLKGRQTWKAWNTTLNRRFGTTNRDVIRQLAEDYVTALNTLNEVQELLKAKSAAADSLYASLSSNEQAILLEIRRFAPDAHDLTTADELLRKCATLRKQLAEAENVAQSACVRRDVLGDRLPPEDDDTPVLAPVRPRQEVEAQLAEVSSTLSRTRSAVDQLSGQILALGDPIELRSEAQHIKDEIKQLEEEYQALALAIEAMDAANGAIQTRFSPALGQRTAEIFREIAGDRYDSVALDRTLHLSVQPKNDPVQRDALLLSTGTLDQLYLAARLAICELVLPRDREIPLILDDALTNFDGTRCAAALDWLKKAAKTRQVILFTCHSREAAHFQGDCEVSVQRLTEAE